MNINQNDDVNKIVNIADMVNEDYDQFSYIWRKMFDTTEGSFYVENARVSQTPQNRNNTFEAIPPGFNPYLPPTETMREDKAYYAAYLKFAKYTNYPGDVIKKQLGLLSMGQESVTLPTDMEYLKNNATFSNDGLRQLQMRINRAQLVFGRYHLLAEPTKDNKFKINEIPAWKFLRAGIMKNDDRIRFILLDVSRTEFNFANKRDEEVSKISVLGLDKANRYYQQEIAPGEWADFDVLNPSNPNYPTWAGNTFDYIPFTAVNASNRMLTTYEIPPNYSLSEDALKLYRISADFYQANHMLTQPTFVIIGGKVKNDKIPTGATKALVLEEKGMDAKYVGIDGNGLPILQEEYDRQHIRCQQQGVSLVDLTGNKSGRAIELVQGAQTASLQTVNNVSGEAITEQLRFIARWMKKSEKEIEETVYAPSSEFAASRLAAQDLIQLWQGKMQGMPISVDSFHGILRENGITDKSVEAELALIAEERNEV